MNTNRIPTGYHTITPYISVPGAAELIDFLKTVFAAEERETITAPNGKILHAEVTIGDSRLMICDPKEDTCLRTGACYLYLADVDATYRRALEAGATSTMAPTDMFWGDRMATVKDRFGNEWQLATRVEEVAPEELQCRMAEMIKQ